MLLLFGVNYSFSTIVSVLVTKDIFGLRQYATVYPKNKLAGSVAYALASSYFGYLFDFTGSYRVTMTLSIVFVIVSLALFLIAYRKKGKAV